ncbi:MAG: hypothetical protein A2X19_02725 [Bacteroidetes bacterium GWE2_39_28]|nr:MAG: hypothetical protein A2X19_02725 [Bacteroidetes bacterium GWE2_39_28]OFY16005.1 MAG: hypothetical protein A2X16_09885 [Bacteroidetes bacterium GWF2_39_10]OFZ07006.1 MAG: hypothetical protein A2322_08540 [Bacteroidetes bacterium RIFOXYB2_FULL_39_7]OFZ09560.1 MAG: hypothetical protein A2465_04940 [Bacteroidetes bacterium RIFOXYC2_FULL_39_11]HCT94359.1 hypothetical protein [Rikenellaceae bacterium]
MKASKPYLATFYFQPVEIKVNATSEAEAKKKALVKLSKLNPTRLVSRDYPTNKKEIFIYKLK